MAPMYIVGTGTYLPEGRLTNDDLCSMVETTHDWIVSHTGMLERRRAAPDQDTSDLGALATQRALDRTGWKGADLELLVCATSTPDRLIPATASLIGKKLEIDPVAFDVNAACSGFAYGLSVAQAMAQLHGYQRVALTVPEKYTRVTDYADRSTCIFFGDSASTLLLSPERPERGLEIVDTILGNINEGAEYVTTPVGGFFWQDGRTVKEYALKAFRDSAKEMLRRNDLDISQLRAFTGHQANLRVLEEVGEMIGLAPEQHWFNVDQCGNQGAAGVSTTFCSKIEEHADELADGDLFLCTVFGSGFTTGSVLLRWVG